MINPFAPYAASSIMVTLLMESFKVLFILGVFPLQKGLSDAEVSPQIGISKRNVLTFPPSSLLQINMGVSLTRDFEKNSAVVVLAFQQFAPLPEETLPLFAQSVVMSGRKFSIYEHLKDVFSSYGFNGSDCLRKMICQIGESPLVGGFLEDVITWVFTPSRHRSVGLNETLDESLLQSEELGRKGGNCTSSYPQCIRTPLDLISTLVHL